MSAFEFEGQRFDLQGAASGVGHDASGKPAFRQVEILAKIRSLRYRGAVVDIGANTGNHCVFFSRFCEFSRIVAVEGPKDLCVILRENARHNENPACPIEVVGAFVSCMRDLYFNEGSKPLPGRWFLTEVPISADSMPVRAATLDELCRDIYSSGMMARLAFGLSMAIEFDVYLVDEITAVGDARFQARCKEAFDARRKNSGLIVVSHSMATIKDYCDCGGVLVDGQLLMFDNVDNAIAKYNRLMRV